MGIRGTKHKSHRQWSKPKNPPNCACGRPAGKARTKPSRVTGEIRTYYAKQCPKCYYRDHPDYRQRMLDRHKSRYVPKPKQSPRYGWRKTALLKSDLTCSQCGFRAAHVGQLDVDHVVPKWRGGTNDPDNLQVICANCHRLKSIRENLEMVAGKTPKKSRAWILSGFRE